MRYQGKWFIYEVTKATRGNLKKIMEAKLHSKKFQI